MTEMKLGRNTILTAGLFSVLLAGATPTLAGFEFKTPTPSVPASMPPSSFPAPISATPMMPQDGPIIWNENVQQMPAQKVPGIEAVPLTQAERRSMPASTPDIVSGFGSDLPLLVALQQVVPQQYKISLSPGVDGSERVSWRGDRPWKAVLSDMLSSAQLAFSVEKNSVIVKRPGGALPSVRVASSVKADMLPQDLLAGSRQERMMPAPVATPSVPPRAPTILWEQKAAAPQPAPLPVQETEVAALSSPAPVLPPPVMPAPPAAKPPLSALPPPISVAEPIAAPVKTTSAPTSFSWRAGKGQTLKEVLRDWTEVAHVKLYWITDYDYKLNSDIAYTGSLEEALGRVFSQFSATKPQPYGRFHKNAETGEVLVVDAYTTPH